MIVPRKNQIIMHRLMKEGFHATMSKHIKRVFRYDGHETGIRTWVSHGKKEIRDHVLFIMAEQLHLSRQQFLDLVDCKLEEKGLIDIYEGMGFL